MGDIVFKNTAAYAAYKSKKSKLSVYQMNAFDILLSNQREVSKKIVDAVYFRVINNY